jgi:DNA polymerase-3 subunit alpha
LEDLKGKVEVMVSSRMLDQVREQLQSDEPVLVIGWVRHEGDEEPRTTKLRMKAVELLTGARLAQTREVHLTLPVAEVDRDRLQCLRELLEKSAGTVPVFLHLVIPDHSETVMALPEGLRVSPTDELLLGAERLFGERVAVLR